MFYERISFYFVELYEIGHQKMPEKVLTAARLCRKGLHRMDLPLAKVVPTPSMQSWVYKERLRSQIITETEQNGNTTRQVHKYSNHLSALSKIVFSF